MLANAKDVEAELIGQLNGFEQIVQALSGAHALACDRVGCQLDKENTPISNSLSGGC